NHNTSYVSHPSTILLTQCNNFTSYPLFILYHLSIFHSNITYSHRLSFPTRRSSDLDQTVKKAVELLESGEAFPKAPVSVEPQKEDRKSTRLNSSHVSISYAVFCLRKKIFIY